MNFCTRKSCLKLLEKSSLKRSSHFTFPYLFQNMRIYIHFLFVTNKYILQCDCKYSNTQMLEYSQHLRVSFSRIITILLNIHLRATLE